MLYGAAVFGKPLNSICLVPAYEDHCRQTILSSFQNKGDFVGAVSVKTSCHIMLYILRSTIFQPYIYKDITCNINETIQYIPCQADPYLN